MRWRNYVKQIIADKLAVTGETASTDRALVITATFS